MNNKNPKILVVDNYDSFTYNLVQIVEEHGHCSFDVIKNDNIDVSSADLYDGFLFSPGPGIPAEIPVMAELLSLYHMRKSILGICLGHQAIAETFGMKLVNLGIVRHGLKARISVTDPSDYLFEGMPPEFDAGVYHSWAVESISGSVPQLRATSLSHDGIIMSVAHVCYDIRGIQFHPESFLSEHRNIMIHNWINHLSHGGSFF